MKNNIKDEIVSLLESTGRENIDHVIKYMDEKGFFEAPASVVHHNNFRGGLAKHSLEVYQEAVKLNKDIGLPETSIILCSLLHDICKADQYEMKNGKPRKIEETIQRGHGRRSLFILKRKCLLPLNYDEEMAIWWHMGDYEKSKDHFMKDYEDSLKNDLCILIHKADGIAAHK